MSALTTAEAVGRTATERRQRLAVDLSPSAFKRLQELQRQFELKSTAEVARVAIDLFNWYAQQRKAGYRIQVAKDGEVREFDFIRY